jgi:hypothetical protein
MNLFVPDPKTKEPSVSLTLLLISTIALIIIGSLHAAGIIQTTSIFTEMFYSTTALYFGRRFNISGKVFSSEKTKPIEKEKE